MVHKFFLIYHNIILFKCFTMSIDSENKFATKDGNKLRIRVSTYLLFGVYTRLTRNRGRPSTFYCHLTVCVFYLYFQEHPWTVEAFSLCMFYFSRLSERSPMEQRAPAQGSSRDQCIRGPSTGAT